LFQRRVIVRRCVLVAFAVALFVGTGGSASADDLLHRLKVAQAGSGFNTSEQYPIDHSNGPTGDSGGSGDGTSYYDGPKPGTCWDLNKKNDCTYGHTIGFPDECVTEPTCQTR
jgi:hypothetical protein